MSPTTTSAGAWPPSSTRATASRAFCPWAPATASVPKTIFRPSVASAIPKVSIARTRPDSIAANPSSV